jgi:hypothetical protein
MASPVPRTYKAAIAVLSLLWALPACELPPGLNLDGGNGNGGSNPPAGVDAGAGAPNTAQPGTEPPSPAPPPAAAPMAAAILGPSAPVAPAAG